MPEAKFDPNQILRASVGLVAESLSDEELAAINICVQLGQDPRGVIGYDKVKHLFTAQTTVTNPFTRKSEVIPVVHEATRDALASVVLSRLPQVQTPPAKLKS